MQTVERWLLYVSTAVVTITGVAYGVMKYFMIPVDPFAVVNHPWQPTMLAVHLMAAPVLMLVVGMVVRSHIIPRLSHGRLNRRSGFGAFGTFLCMAASGYLLQVVSSPGMTRVVLAAHLVSSGLFVAAFLVHLVIGLRPVARRRRDPESAVSVTDRAVA